MKRLGWVRLILEPDSEDFSLLPVDLGKALMLRLSEQVDVVVSVVVKPLDRAMELKTILLLNALLQQSGYNDRNTVKFVSVPIKTGSLVLIEVP